MPGDWTDLISAIQGAVQNYQTAGRRADARSRGDFVQDYLLSGALNRVGAGDTEAAPQSPHWSQRFIPQGFNAQQSLAPSYGNLSGLPKPSQSGDPNMRSLYLRMLQEFMKQRRAGGGGGGGGNMSGIPTALKGLGGGLQGLLGGGGSTGVAGVAGMFGGY